MSTPTITEFLEARIAEDEAVVYNVMPADVETFYDGHWVNGPVSSERLLAECAAKRAIIKQHEDWPVLVEKKPEFSEDTSDIHSMTYRASQELAWLTEREYVKRFGVQAPTTNMVKALASVYADHPDYAQEWAL